jgi:hypothetical protein
VPRIFNKSRKINDLRDFVMKGVMILLMIYVLCLDPICKEVKHVIPNQPEADEGPRRIKGNHIY